MENYITKAADAFLTSRPYGIRLDFKRKGFCFQSLHKSLSNKVLGYVNSLPLKNFTIEDIPKPEKES